MYVYTCMNHGVVITFNDMQRELLSIMISEDSEHIFSEVVWALRDGESAVAVVLVRASDRTKHEL